MQHIGYVTGICFFVCLPFHQQRDVEDYLLCDSSAPICSVLEYLTSVLLAPFTDVRTWTRTRTLVECGLIPADADDEMFASAHL